MSEIYALSVGQETFLGRWEGILVKTGADHPSFHLFRLGLGPGGHDYAMCGRKIWAGAAWLPIKHLSKFASPCVSCAKARISQIKQGGEND